jgi:opacity protein-like surface antigen
VLIAGDMIHPNNDKELYNIGLEYGMKEMIFLRTGYKISADEGGLSIGGGANLDLMQSFKISVDYSYADMGVLNGINRFSINLLF